MIIGQLEKDRLVLSRSARHTRDVIVGLVELVRRPRQRPRAGADRLKRIEQQHRLRLEQRQPNGTAEHSHAERRLLRRLESCGDDEILSGFQ